MEVSLNLNWLGKPEKRDGKLYYKNKAVNLGFNWTKFDLSFEEIFELISNIGLSIGPVVVNGHRVASKFISHSIAMIDIDNGMKISELMNHPYYKKYGSGFYTSSSHTTDNHKFRILFKLEEPITDISQMKKLYSGLMQEFEFADTACKDGVRLFYGSIEADERELTDRFLNRGEIKRLIESVITIPTPEPIIYKPSSDIEKRAIIELLKNMLMDYSTWLRIGFGLKSGGYNYIDFLEATNEVDGNEARKVWGSIGNSISMGSVIYEINQYYGRGIIDKKKWELLALMCKNK